MVVILKKVMFKDVPIGGEFIFNGDKHTRFNDLVAQDYQGIKKIFTNDKEVFIIERKVEE